MEDCADWFGRASPAKRCGCLSICVGLVTLIVWIAVALEGVEPTEYAIIKNNINQSINDDLIYQGGLHWVGVFYSLVQFPSIHKSIEFSQDANAQYGRLKTRTKEGLDLQISFAFQYQLIQEELPQLYLKGQDYYEEIFARIARNAVLEAASDYNAPSYWSERSAIGKSMEDELTIQMLAFHAKVTGFMLLKIDLPDSYENAIVRTEVTNQEYQTYNQIRKVNLTNQDTENLKASKLADILRINSSAKAEATKVLNRGAGNVARQNIEYTTLALKEVQDKLNFAKPKDSLMEYFFWQKIGQLSSATKNRLIIGPEVELLD